MTIRPISPPEYILTTLLEGWPFLLIGMLLAFLLSKILSFKKILAVSIIAFVIPAGAFIIYMTQLYNPCPPPAPDEPQIIINPIYCQRPHPLGYIYDYSLFLLEYFAGILLAVKITSLKEKS